MVKELINILLIDDDEDEYVITRDTLAELGEDVFKISWASSYEKGLEEIATNKYQLVLLDYHLGKFTGIELLRYLKVWGMNIPVIMLTGQGNNEIDLLAMQDGAMGYLDKKNLNATILDRSIRYAIAQYDLQEQLRKLSNTDVLTGLHNRRGFQILAQQQIRIASRKKDQLVLMIMDLDGLKKINDTHGHQEGDNALIAFGDALTKTFRMSDIVARLSGDEFAVLATDAKESDGGILKDRLIANIDAYNASGSSIFTLSASCGSTTFKTDEEMSFEDLMKIADADLYNEKREKRRKE